LSEKFKLEKNLINKAFVYLINNFTKCAYFSFHGFKDQSSCSLATISSTSFHVVWLNSKDHATGFIK
jgi:hypothetical protein